jgi:serine/threonine-protein kinase
MYAHLQQPPPLVTNVKPDLPKRVDQVVAAAMTKDPARRPATAGAFAAALSEAIRPVAAPAPVRTNQARTVVLGGGAALAVVALIAAAALLGHHPAPTPTTAPSGHPTTLPLFSGLVRIDPATGAVQGSVPIVISESNTKYSKVIAEGDGVVWFLDPEGFHLFKVSSAGNLIGTIDVLHSAQLAAGDGAVWLGSDPILTAGGPLQRIDPASNRVVRTLNIPRCCTSLAVSPGAVWPAAQTQFFRVDPRSGSVHTYDFGGQDLAVDQGRVWVLDILEGSVRSIDTRTGTAASPIRLPGSPVAVTAGFGAVWVSTQEGDVFRIPVTAGGSIDTISVGGGLSDISAGGGAVWVVDPAGRAVVRIDPNTLKVTGRTPVDGTPSAVTATSTAVWVAVEPQAPPTPNVGG